jgi:hypothetical protein
MSYNKQLTAQRFLATEFLALIHPDGGFLADSALFHFWSCS